MEPNLKFFGRLVEAHPAIQNPEHRRRVVLLSVIALFGFLYFIVSAFLAFIPLNINSNPIPVLSPLQEKELLFAILFGIIFGLSRSRFYAVASAMTVIASMGAIFANLFAGPFNPVFLSYLIVGVIVSGLLYSWRGILLISLVNITGIILLTFLLPGNWVTDIHLILGQVILVSSLVLITSFLWQKDREQIERQARQVILSENHFRKLLDSSDDVIMILSEHGVIRFSSPSVRGVLGYEPHELVETPILEHIHPDERKTIADSLNAEDPDGTVPGLMIRIQSKENNWKLFEVRFGEKLNSTDLEGTIVNFRDITGRKKSETLKEVTYRISQMVNSSNNLDELYQIIHNSLAELVEVGNFYIALYDAEKDLLGFEYFVDQFDEQPESRKPGHGLTEYLLRTGRSLHATEPVIEKLTREGEIELVGSESVDWLGVPLKVNERIIGVMVTQSYTEGIHFNEEDRELFEFVSSQVAMAIERKRSEDAIRGAEGILRGMVNSTMDSVFLLDTSEVVQLVNKEAARRLGKSPSDIQGAKYSTILPDALYRNGKTHLDQVIQTGLPEFWEDHHEGNFFEINAYPIKGQRGDVAHLAIFAHDITERKKVHNALQEAEEKYRQLVEQIPVVVYVDAPDSQSSSLYMSPLITSFTGYSPQEWIDDPGLWTRLIHPDDLERVLAENNRTNKTGEVFKTEYRLMARDGRQVWVSDEAKPQNDENGNPKYWKGVLVDITDRKQAEIKEKQRVQELETLYQTSMEINSQTGLNSLLKLIVERAASLLGVESGGLYLIEPDGQSLTLLIGIGMLEKFLGKKLQLGEGLSGQVAQQGKTLAVEDYQQWAERSRIYDGSSFHRTLAVPLKAKEKVIGVINVSDTVRSGSFSPEEIRLLSLFADQAAISIEKAQLYERELTRTRELTSLYSSSMTLSTNITLDSALESIFKQMIQVINVDGCTLSLWDKDGDVVRTIADHREKSPEKKDPPGTQFSLKEYPATRKVLETRQYLLQVVDDPQVDKAEAKLMEEQSKQVLLLLPMVARDKVLGLMELYNEEKKDHAFYDSEIQLAMSLAAQTAIFIENVRLFEDAQRRLQRTQALHEIDMAISGFVNINPVLEVALKHVLAELSVDAAVILLFDQEQQSLNYALGSGLRTSALKFTSLHLGEGYAGLSALQRKTIHIPNLQTRTTDFLRSPTFTKEGFIAYYAVPLVAKGQVMGVLEIFNRSPLNPDQEWLEFMEILAGQVGIAIDNANLYSGLQRSNQELTLAYDATIEGWSKALDMRDKETEGHTLRVTQMTGSLAQSIGLSKTEITYLYRGALLHDIGKMSIPDSILLKPGPLTAEEWQVMRCHPTFAFDMLSPINYLHPSLDIPYCHHEKWDGSGYPRGLHGDAIPLSARLFAIVDVWDALTSNRPYRQAWEKTKALEYIRSESGTHFDPGVMEPFLNLINQNHK